MFSLLEFHVVNLTWGLCPLVSILIWELHPFGHLFVPVMREGISHESRVITLPNKALEFTPICFLGLCGCSLALFLCAVMNLVVVKDGGVHVVFIIDLLCAEDGLLVRDPEDLPVAPFVHWAVWPADALEPSVDWSVVEFDAVVGGWFKFIRIEVFHHSSLPSGANRLLTGFSASEDFNMHDIVTLSSQLSVEIGTTIEDKVTWLHLFKLESDGQGVILVCLVPTVKVEP